MCDTIKGILELLRGLELGPTGGRNRKDFEGTEEGENPKLYQVLRWE